MRAAVLRLAACLAVLGGAASAHAAAFVVVTGCSVTDVCDAGGPASGNGLLDPGENGTLVVTLRNQGDVTATRLRALLASPNAELELLLDTLDFPDLAPGASARSVEVPFRFAADTSCGSSWAIDVTLGYSGTLRPDSCALDVPVNCFPCGADPCLASRLTPWSAGPYGIELDDVAGDFTVPTTAGDWTLSTGWSGCDNYVFIVRIPGFAYSENLWNSSVQTLLQQSPDNAHYFFISASADPGEVASDIADIRARADAALARLGAADRAHWTPRLHHVTQGLPAMGNWLTDFGNAHGVTAWAVDSFQRVRQAGLLFFVGGPNSPEMRFMTHEVRHYNFERERKRQLDYETFVTVPVWENVLMNAGQQDIVLPDARQMARFDTMLFELSWKCTDPWNSLSCEWDYLANLNICRTDDPTQCPWEFGRWITPYGRGGRWVTDMTPYMALIRQGGTRRVSFYTPYTYDMTLRIHLTNRGKGIRPESFQPLWGGGNFEDPNYNADHPPITFEAQAWAERVEVAAMITGHGFGNQQENCAEFCNHQHRFTLNGAASVMQEFPEAQTQYGCVEQIEAGTVPNQYGTWHYGRGGWCPGLDVPAWSGDLTSAVVPGTNTLTYEGLFNGAPYVPTYPGQSPGFGARIDMSSYLVMYAQTPEADCDDGLDDDADGRTDCADPGCLTEAACDTGDTDGDGTPNDTDCAPTDATLEASPEGLAWVRADRSGASDAVLTWPELDSAAGSATRVDVLTGLVSELRADGGYARGTCLVRDAASLTDSRRVVAAQDAYWYILRADNACGTAPFDPPELQVSSPCD